MLPLHHCSVKPGFFAHLNFVCTVVKSVVETEKAWSLALHPWPVFHTHHRFSVNVNTTKRLMCVLFYGAGHQSHIPWHCFSFYARPHCIAKAGLPLRLLYPSPGCASPCSARWPFPSLPCLYFKTEFLRTYSNTVLAFLHSRPWGSLRRMHSERAHGSRVLEP